MICVNLSDLQRKDVVNLQDGKRLGRIVDVHIHENGSIESFSVMPLRFWKFWKSNNEVTITFPQIKRIGTDVILVETI